MKKLIVLMLLFCITACVPDWVVKGDSMGWGLAKIWQSITSLWIENDGIIGACIEQFLPEKRQIPKGVIFGGINNEGWFWNIPVKYSIKDYQTYHTNLKKHVKKVICVTVPHVIKYAGTDVSESFLNDIKKLNAAITKKCGPEYTVQSWDIPFTHVGDGEHPDDQMNKKILEKILEIDAATDLMNTDTESESMESETTETE